MKCIRLGLLLGAATFGFHQPDPWLEQMMAGNRLRLSGDAPGSEKYYLAALELARSLGENHTRYGQALNNLAGAYHDQRDYARAEALFLRALAIQEKTIGPSNHGVELCLNNLGVLYGEMGRFAEAEAVYRRVIIAHDQQRAASEDQLAIALGNLGALYFEAGRLDSAEPLLRRAVPLADRLLGPNHRKTIRIALVLGSLEYAKGRYSQAEMVWSRALSATDGSSAPDRITAATLRMNLGELRRFERRFADSELLLRSAIEELEKDGNQPLLPAALNHLALTYVEQGRAADAEPVYLRALSILSGDLRPLARRQHAVILSNLGRLREQQRALFEAASLFRQALDSAEQGFGFGHPSLKGFLTDSARLQRVLRHTREADALERRARRIHALDPLHDTVDVRDIRRLEADRRKR